MTIKLTVDGMHCKACVMLVEEALEDIKATDIKVTLTGDNQGTVECTHPDTMTVINAIKKEGYKVRK